MNGCKLTVSSVLIFFCLFLDFLRSPFLQTSLMNILHCSITFARNNKWTMFFQTYPTFNVREFRRTIIQSRVRFNFLGLICAGNLQILLFPHLLFFPLIFFIILSFKRMISNYKFFMFCIFQMKYLPNVNFIIF